MPKHHLNSGILNYLNKIVIVVLIPAAGAVVVLTFRLLFYLLSYPVMCLKLINYNN